MTSLAEVYWRWGRFDEAETVLTRAVKQQSRVLGEEHPATLEATNALGDLYRRQGRHDEAASLLGRALDARRRTLGDDHPDIAGSLQALGCLAAARGERQEAIDLLRQAVDRGWARRTLLDDTDLASLRGDPEFEAITSAVRKRLHIVTEPNPPE